MTNEKDFLLIFRLLGDIRFNL